MTSCSFQARMSEHRDYPKRDVTTEPSGNHFTQRGHSVSDLKGLVLEQVKSKDPYVLRARENMLIKKFDTYRKGLNNEPWLRMTLAAFLLSTETIMFISCFHMLCCVVWTGISQNSKYITTKQFSNLALSLDLSFHQPTDIFEIYKTLSATMPLSSIRYPL